MIEREIILLKRDTMAMLVPSGAPMMVPAGTEVSIEQSLGGTYTVNLYGNLARIDGKDADALGKEPYDPLQDLPPDATLKDKVWAQLHSVYDPEIPVNIVDLGLVYDLEISQLNDDSHQVQIVMTLTAPGCGMGPVIAEDAKQKVLSVPSISQVEVEVVFDPPWDREMMSETAKLHLGMF